MRYVILGTLLWLCAACQTDAVFERYEELPEERWNRLQAIEFVVEIPDSALYEVEICIRHTKDFETANLWCFVSAHVEGSEKMRDTLNLQIAELDGRWLGSGGIIKEITEPLRRNPMALPAGTVVFKVEQGMRTEELQGMKNVGLRVSRITGTEEDGDGKE